MDAQWKVKNKVFVVYASLLVTRNVPIDQEVLVFLSTVIYDQEGSFARDGQMVSALPPYLSRLEESGLGQGGQHVVEVCVFDHVKDFLEEDFFYLIEADRSSGEEESDCYARISVRDQAPCSLGRTGWTVFHNPFPLSGHFVY